MTGYEDIKSSCLERHVLWEDPDFPPTQTSVFYHQTPPFNFVWIRAKELYHNPVFVSNSSSDTFDVVPGKMGDKWLASCLGVLYQSRLFYRVVPADQKFDEAYAGVFRFRLWWCGQWVEVLVDDRLPTVNGRLAFLQASHSHQLWPALLEKAYAKLHGSYEALKYGCSLDGLADLTGGITEVVPMEQLADPQALQAFLNTTSLVTVALCVSTTTEQEEQQQYIKLNTNYRILNVEMVESAIGPQYVVQVYRPPAPGETTLTHLVDDVSKWRAIPSVVRVRLIGQGKGFWMLFPELRTRFSQVELVHLDAETSRDEPTLAERPRWHMRMYQGGWRRGVTAGGCRNNAEFFHMNPQVQLFLEEPSTVIISLNQHSFMEPKIIGFSVYLLASGQHFTETVPAYFFKQNRSTINSQYTNSRQVSHRCELDAGAYLVLPTTFDPREEANFTLRVFSSRSLKFKVLDIAPKMLRAGVLRAPPGCSNFAQYEAIFLQLADEHRTIDPFQLQEILDACLPNDYIKSVASIETCRQIVLTLDNIRITYSQSVAQDSKEDQFTDHSQDFYTRSLMDELLNSPKHNYQMKGTGRISMAEFKDLMCSLKYWQVMFREHAREKMGVLRAERLRDALRDVGFQVPERALALLVLRYMRKDGMLRFGDFVSAVLHLQRAFNILDSKKLTNSSDINLSLAEWLKI